MARYIDTEIKHNPFRVLVKTKHMLNEVDDTLMVPSEHLFDFNDDKDSLPTEPDEEHTLLREFGFIQ